jgi:hypothetical protein
VGLFKKADVTEVVTNQRGVTLDKDQVFNKYGETIKHKSDRTLGAICDAGEPIIIWDLYVEHRERGKKRKAKDTSKASSKASSYSSSSSSSSSSSNGKRRKR